MADNYKFPDEMDNEDELVENNIEIEIEDDTPEEDLSLIHI